MHTILLSWTLLIMNYIDHATALTAQYIVNCAVVNSSSESNNIYFLKLLLNY